MKYTLAVYLLIISLQVFGQKYESSQSTITFFAEAPIEDIDAINKKANSTFDANNLKIDFSVPIDQFQFDKSLMKKHFNENYLESEKFPNATFSGIIKSYDPSYTSQSAAAVGKMTIHGVTRTVEISGKIEKKSDRLTITSDFKVLLDDYDIKKPKLLWNTITEDIAVKIEFTYKRLEN